VAVVALTVGHFFAASAARSQQAVHVALQALYVVPVLAGAIWFGLLGGAIASVAVAAAYSLHLWHAWPGEPLDYLNQSAMVVIFLVIGPVAGGLVDLQERERRRALEVERRVRRVAIIQSIAGLSTALGFRDQYTRQHSTRVAELAVRVGRARGLAADRLERLHLAALVHDLGKIGVPDDILFKAHELTAQERSIVQRHPSVAADILSRIDGTNDIADIVLSHHESPDGTGYPRGLSAEHISMEAAILRVADVFSALTDARTYKSAMDDAAALTWMLERADKDFDRASVETLRRLFAQP
jgi:putative nucleotidyltransferase with HDIG domain